MQDLERLHELELLERFNALQNETDIHAFHAFCNSDDGKLLFNTLSQSPNYSHLKEFERIIPFYIDARISQSLAGVTSIDNLRSIDLGLKKLLENDAITQVENKLKDEIASNMRDNNISAQEAFPKVKELGFWQKILDWLSIFISVNAQLQNTTSNFVQQKLQQKKQYRMHFFANITC